MPPRVCPNCGATVPPRSLACHECGSDDETGWSEDAETGNLDLPDDHFDYNEFVAREFNESSQRKPHGIPWFWWVVAILVVAVMLLALLHAH